MTIDSINKEDKDGYTPLDDWYRYNISPIQHKQEMIALIRLKGGIANNYDENGNFIEDEDDEEEDYY